VDIDRDAPVVVEKTVEIGAPPEIVWDVLTDVEHWPDWNSGVKSATLDGAFAAGSRFRWKSGPSRIRSTVEAAERPRLAGWSGKALGARAVHVWQLEPTAGGTRVTTEESMSGPVPRLFAGSMKRMLEKSLDAWLAEMSGAAERRGR
jgi:uncharacterized protein YndB with AHSA1/START domain